MKKTRSLIIMTALLVVLVGAYALWQITGGFPLGTSETSTPTTSASTEALADFTAEEIDQIRLTNEKGSLVFRPTWNQPTPTPVSSEDPQATATPSPQATPTPVLSWVLVEPQVQDLSGDLLNTLANRLLSINVTEDIGVKEAGELAPYGLEGDGTASLVYRLKNGEEVTIVLGTKVQASTAERYYAMNRGEGRVAVISTAGSHLQTGPLDLINKDVISLSADDLIGFSLKRQTEDFTIEGELLPNEEETAADQWAMKSPVAWKGNASNIQNFLAEIAEIRADEVYEATEGELGRFGLQTPYYRVTLRTAGEEKVLLISNQGSSDLAYAMIEGKDYFFSFNRQVLTQTGIPALDFYDKFAALVNITNVGELTLTLGGNRYVSDVFNPTREEIDQAKEQGLVEPSPAYTLNGLDANLTNEHDDNLFTKYYQTLIGVMVSGFDPEARPLADEPLYEVSYQMRNGDEDITLSFVSRDAQTLYLFKDGVYTGFYCPLADFTSKANVDEPGVELALNTLLEAQGEKNPDTTETTTTSETTDTTDTAETTETGAETTGEAG